MTAADGGRRDAEMHIGKRLHQGFEVSRRLHDVRAALRPPLGSIARDLRPRSDNGKLAEAEILHCARGRADVAGFVGLDQDYANAHSSCKTDSSSISGHVRM